jgi:hypothetical protein
LLVNRKSFAAKPDSVFRMINCRSSSASCQQISSSCDFGMPPGIAKTVPIDLPLIYEAK